MEKRKKNQCKKKGNAITNVSVAITITRRKCFPLQLKDTKLGEGVDPARTKTPLVTPLRSQMTPLSLSQWVKGRSLPQIGWSHGTQQAGRGAMRLPIEIPEQEVWFTGALGRPAGPFIKIMRAPH